MATYIETLDVCTKMRYFDKIKLIDDVDPYEIRPKIDDQHFPVLNLWSIGKYFVYTKSAYTSQDFNAYKSLKAFNLYQCDWVKEVYGMKIKDKYLIIGKVMHSQKLNEKPANPWVISGADGDIYAAHCTCLAGLGEACSHIGAILFYVEDKMKNVETKSVTDEQAYWASPAGVKKAKMEQAGKINYHHPLKKFKQSCTGNAENKKVHTQKEISELSDQELSLFLSKLNETDTGSNNPPAILTIVSPFNDKYAIQKTEPSDLRNLFKNEFQELTLEELQQESKNIILHLTEEQCERVNKNTIKQAKSKLWFQYRAGRITASVMKRCCLTNLEKPSITLIKQICYPEKMKFISAATAWGCSHEKVARDLYVKSKINSHVNFEIKDSGLILNSKYPHLGASPDGIVQCDCCGLGCIEIKCPFCLRNASPEEVAESASFLKTNEDVQLDKNHGYFYQVQTQIFLGDFQYCDFIVYTEKSFFVQKIFRDSDFWEEILNNATTFFQKVILPELLGKAWTNASEKKSQPSSSSNRIDEKKPCIVRLKTL